MAHVVYAWELGGNLGHLTNFSLVARYLREAGHRVTLVVRRTERVSEFFQSDVRVFQAPIARGAEARNFLPETWADIARNNGFGSFLELNNLVNQWRGLYEQLAPDVLVFNFPAVSSLAARGFGVATANIGVGYSVPPRQSPLPPIQPMRRESSPRNLSVEKEVVGVANRVLSALDQSTITAAHEIAEVTQELLCSFAEMDHYPSRPHGDYLGASFELDVPASARWPSGAEMKIFAYARQASPHFSALVCGLRESGLSSLLIASGLSEVQAKELSSTNLHVSHLPVSIRRAREQARIAICPGGHGTMAAFLLAGVPVFALPEHLEQAVQAGVAQMSQVGVATLPVDRSLAPIFQAAVHDEKLQAQAKAFAMKYKDFTPERQARSLAEQLVALV